MSLLTPSQRETLRSLCDTFVPSLETPDSHGFWARKASDLGVEGELERFMLTLPQKDREGLGQLLEALGKLGFKRLPRTWRELTVHSLSGLSPDVRKGFDAFRALTMMFFYGLTDEEGGNPNWSALSYAGAPKVDPLPDGGRLEPLIPSDDTTITADVVVVGSGAGGGTIAGTLATKGLRVVLEAGGYYHEGTFPMTELEAYQKLYWRGGHRPTAEGTVQLIAGGTLGGGTTVNWSNCVQPPAHVRQEWAEEHGLEGLDSSTFDRHLQEVSRRISATDTLSDANDPNSRLREACEKLKQPFKVAMRNASLEGYSPDSAGYMGFGDRSGSKQSTVKTYLQDVAANGGTIIANCRAERILTEGGRAAGVEARYRDGTHEFKVTVRAPHVVAAGGALETPALLLRSGIGGEAVGRYLHLHPALATIGYYPKEQRNDWGAPQTIIGDGFANLTDGYGFLLECVHHGTYLYAASIPWRSGRDHKELMQRVAHSSTFISVLRDRGHGRVTVDGAGEAVIHYPLTDELDKRHLLKALETLITLHAAAGAEAILDVSPPRPLWQQGQDLAKFIKRVERIPFSATGRTLFSAHQMGSARMGRDKKTSVANPWGELHDVKGVWIGDTSAFPTAVGSNPMLSCMALAHRTAEVILEQSQVLQVQAT